MKTKLCTLLIAIQTAVYAQLPDTDIWLFDIVSGKDSIVISNPQNITNRNGYDNQPAFSPDGKYILYTSIRDEKQSDIYKYDIQSKQNTQFTSTTTSEYSPTFMPDGKNISVVMVEPDSTQRLWKISVKSKKEKVLVKEVDSVGYYTWFSGKRIAVYILTEPHSLNLISEKYPMVKFVDDSIGRCFKYHNAFLLYSKKMKDGRYVIKLFNLPGWHTSETKTIIESEDFEVLSDKIIYGLDSKLYEVKLHSQNKKMIADLSSFGIIGITRIAMSPDGKKIAIVATKK